MKISNEKTLTKKAVLTAVATFLEERDEVFVIRKSEEEEETFTAQEMAEFVNVMIAQMNEKNEKSRTTRAKKTKEENDVTQAVIINVLMPQEENEELWLNRDEIAEKTGFTPNKISAQMRKLIEGGVAEKKEVKVDKKRKVVYRLIMREKTEE